MPEGHKRFPRFLFSPALPFPVLRLSGGCQGPARAVPCSPTLLPGTDGLSPPATASTAPCAQPTFPGSPGGPCAASRDTDAALAMAMAAGTPALLRGPSPQAALPRCFPTPFLLPWASAQRASVRRPSLPALWKVTSPTPPLYFC